MRTTLCHLLLALFLGACAPPVIPDDGLRAQDLAGCETNAECVVVAAGICGGPAAINGANLKAWQTYLQRKIEQGPSVVCAPTLPLNSFKAICHGERCRAVDIHCEALFEDAPAGHYEKLIASAPVIVDLKRELEVVMIELVGECVSQGTVPALLHLQVPETYSRFGVSYRDEIGVIWSEDGSVQPTFQPSFSDIRDLEVVTNRALSEFLKWKVETLESDARIAEFLVKAWPRGHDRNPVSLSDTNVTYRTSHGYITYNFFSGMVRDYQVPNDLSWDAFPEIQLTHQIVERELLIGDLAQCRIGREGGNDYTQTMFHDEEPGPWYMVVALHCGEDDSWGSVTLQLNPDGSYENALLDVDIPGEFRD